MPGKSHGQRSLVGYSPWGRKEPDTTERLHFFTLKFHLAKLLFKMATQEDPKLTSSHRHTEFRATYGQVFLLRKPKVRLSGKQETTWKQTYSLNINPAPRTACHNQKKTQNPEFLPKRKNFEPHIGHLTFQYLHLRDEPPKAPTLKANRAHILGPTGL